MAKFSGLVGYVNEVETSPGIWKPEVTERLMRGDIYSGSSSAPTSDKVNNDIRMQGKISLLGDEFAYGNFMYMRYIYLHGAKWEITAVEVKRPRLNVTLGGVWNGRG